MEKKICEICKRRKAHKKLVSNLDGSFVLLCKKKKCTEEIHRYMDNPKEANLVTKIFSVLGVNKETSTMDKNLMQNLWDRIKPHIR
jgi:hypothetical protein